MTLAPEAKRHYALQGRYFDLEVVGSSYLIIEPSLAGLQWILERHWNMKDRSPENFSHLMWDFLYLQNVMPMTAGEKMEVDILGVSDVLVVEGVCYLLPGDTNGITAIQKLGRDWYLECPNIYTKGNRDAEVQSND